MAVLNIVDIVVLCLHFVVIIAVGLWSVFRPGNRGSSKGYFLAGRDMPFWAVGGSLFASNIGSEHFTGLAGSGVVSGIAYSSYEINAVWVLLLLGEQIYNFTFFFSTSLTLKIKKTTKGKIPEHQGVDVASFNNKKTP